MGDASINDYAVADSAEDYSASFKLENLRLQKSLQLGEFTHGTELGLDDRVVNSVDCYTRQDRDEMMNLALNVGMS